MIPLSLLFANLLPALAGAIDVRRGGCRDGGSGRIRLRKQRAAEALDGRRSPSSWIFFSRPLSCPPVVFLRYGFRHFFTRLQSLADPFLASLARHTHPFRSVPGRWARGLPAPSGPETVATWGDHPSPVQQEYIRTNCGGEFISSSLTAVSVTELCGY
jgi:hypothetical protein